MVLTPQPIIDLLLPCAAVFKASIAAADAANQQVPVSARGMADLLPYLASTVWQDCLEVMTDPDRPTEYTRNPVFKLLLEGPQAELVRCGSQNTCRQETPLWWHCRHCCAHHT